MLEKESTRIYVGTWEHKYRATHKVRNYFNLGIVQQDATYSVYYISVGSSTCFGC